MSDYYIRFIPEDIYIDLDENSIKLIEKLEWDGNTPKFIFNEQMHFADAGQYFESVKCPSCNTNLMEWWGNAMDSAYSDEHGFINIKTTTPCCSMKTSLHNLKYNLPQGFYKTMIEVIPRLDNQVIPADIVDNLFNITGDKWRVINARY